MHNNTSQLEEFRQALYENASLYGVDIDDELICALLTTTNFLTPGIRGCIWSRHVRPTNSRRGTSWSHCCCSSACPKVPGVVDVGSGAGLPIIPCLIARPDLNAVLSNHRRGRQCFSREALRLNKNSGSAEVVAKRFEDVSTPPADFITSRALDRFAEILPALIEWSPRPSKLLLFGGENLKRRLDSLFQEFAEHSIPRSNKRFLFVVERK